LKHMRWDPKDGDLFLNRAKTEETSLEARSGQRLPKGGWAVARDIWNSNQPLPGGEPAVLP